MYDALNGSSSIKTYEKLIKHLLKNKKAVLMLLLILHMYYCIYI